MNSMIPVNHIEPENNLQFRRMRMEDIPEILIIERESFSVPWSVNAFANEIQNPDTSYFVLEEEGVIIGYAGYWKILKDANITNIALALKERGKGKGTLLVHMLKQMAEAEGMDNLTLEVRESNRAAIAAYQRNDFMISGIRKNYYTKPQEHALIMWATVKKEENNENGTKSN